MKKISVIIPVYNAERYIEQCLWSVTGQTYGSLEIIAVDDGSADDSAAVCGRLAETDGRIRVLRQKNSGVSAARNLGLNAATGEYVFFLDSDDAIHPRLLEEMLWQAEENHAQLVFCGYRKLDSDRLGAVLEAASGSAGEAQREAVSGSEEKTQREAVSGSAGEAQREAVSGSAGKARREAVSGSAGEAQREAVSGSAGKARREAVSGSAGEAQWEAVSGSAGKAQREAVSGSAGKARRETVSGSAGKARREAVSGSEEKTQRGTASGTVEEPALPETGWGRKSDCPEVSERAGRARCLAADEAGTEEWFHVKYTDTFSGIGGKLILREAVGELRFDRGLINGEDTFFLYQLVRNRVRSVYCLEEWYYYRMHGESVTSSAGTARRMGYFESAVRIRDGEYGRGNAEHAMRWEILAVDQIRRSYETQRRRKTGRAEGTGSAGRTGGAEGTGSVERTGRAEGAGSAERTGRAERAGSAERTGRGKAGGTGNVGSAGARGKADRDGEGGGAEKARRELRKIAAEEKRHPLFRRICLSDRLLFACCFGCYPAYVILNRIILGLAKRRSR